MNASAMVNAVLSRSRARRFLPGLFLVTEITETNHEITETISFLCDLGSNLRVLCVSAWWFGCGCAAPGLLSVARPGQDGRQRHLPLRRLGIVIALLGASASAAIPVADETAVALPPLLVEARGIPLRWRYLALPGLEMLSVCDDSTSEKFVRRQL